MRAQGKTDRGKLPDAGSVLEKVSDATALVFEAPSTEEEARMAKLWEEVLKKHVGVSTPFVAYGANSLVALSLSSKILSSFGARPDLGFLMSDDCTVSALVKQLTEQAPRPPGRSWRSGAGQSRRSCCHSVGHSAARPATACVRRRKTERPTD